MKSKLFLWAVLLTFLHGYVASNERIYGGYQVDITKAPYMAFVALIIEKYADGTAKSYDCGGTILRENLILTAGHCELKTRP